MIAIPALHDATKDQPVRYTPVCSHTAIPVCLNPTYTSYLPTVVTALTPVLNEVAGLPGAPAHISQAAATYQQGSGNSVNVRLASAAPGRTTCWAHHPGPAAMTADTARNVPAAAPDHKARLACLPRPGMRLLWLHAASRRVPAAIAAIAACAIGLKIALIGHWDSYGALQLPLVFEAGSAAAITITTASALGEPERVTGRWVPFLRLATALALTAAAAGALTGAGTGAHLAGGILDVLRNLAGMTGIGLLCAAALGGRLAWAGPVGYLVVSAYGLYSQWHGSALTTPWIWLARPPHDLGAAICAALVFTIGMTVITVRGAPDPVGE